MKKTNLEQQDARLQSLMSLAGAMGWMKDVRGCFSDLTQNDVTLVICYNDMSFKKLPWSQYREDTIKLMMDTM